MITVVISHLMAVASLLYPGKPAADVNVPEGRYIGSVFLLNVFMRVSGDTAFVEFVSWDKYPREVTVDTLYHSELRDSWTGRYSLLTSDDQKYYIRHNPQAPFPILAEKMKLRMRREDQVYRKKVDSRNLAMLHAYYREYLKKHAAPEMRLLYYQNLYQMVDKRAGHDIFKRQFEKYRAILESKVAAT
jgi:hypothetical protein